MEQAQIDSLIADIEEAKLSNLNSSIIKDIKNKVLQRMLMSREELKLYHKLLSQYRYVDELDELRYGSYIRWFNLKKTDSLNLLRGAFIVDIKPTKDDMLIVCKGGGNRFFQIKMNECILFQKNTPHEELLIKILDQVKE
jgi:hypothetical protein